MIIMSKSERRLLLRILLAGVLLAAAMLVRAGEVVRVILFVAAYLAVGADIVFKALRNIVKGQVFDENFLMTVATVGAFCLREYAEGVAVMLFYQVGELFQSYAVSKSRRSITELMDIRPDYANKLVDGKTVRIDPEDAVAGDIIVILPGERVPLDGVVTDGTSALDTSALTGESAPREVAVGDPVISGCINNTGRLTVQVTRVYGESTVVKILELVENSSDKKAKSENFITRFAKYYTPAVVLAAVVLAVVPPLFASPVNAAAFAVWVERALTFLVISCPCALVISVPLSFFGGIGGASRSGVLVKGSNYLEVLARVDTVIFDKTGTLTKGNFVVSKVVPADGGSADELIRLAAYAESGSNHPIAKSIVRAYGEEVDYPAVESAEEIAGNGVVAVVGAEKIFAGNAKLMRAKEIDFVQAQGAGTVVYIAVNNVYKGYILIEDELKPDAYMAVAGLKADGIKETIMLTGDSAAVGKSVAERLGIDRVYTEMLPADKVRVAEEIMSDPSRKGVAFVGDGINDAPVLARADVGVAMGGLGSDAAIEAADVVIMTDEPYKLVTARKIARKTLGIVRQNIIFALGIKAIVLVLGALGFASMWAAVFADVGVSVLAILNAMRALKRMKSEKVG